MNEPSVTLPHPWPFVDGLLRAHYRAIQEHLYRTHNTIRRYTHIHSSTHQDASRCSSSSWHSPLRSPLLSVCIADEHCRRVPGSHTVPVLSTCYFFRVATNGTLHNLHFIHIVRLQNKLVNFVIVMPPITKDSIGGICTSGCKILSS